MNDAVESILRKVSSLEIYRRGDRRAQHKPLLLLLAIGQLSPGHSRLGFREIEERLSPLL